ncbi:P1 family peptidase [Gemmatimonadota bacterium]
MATVSVGLLFFWVAGAVGQVVATDRPRSSDLGITIGRFPTGPLNAITDVPDLRVGQVSLIEGGDIRTGVTAIVPHGGNIFREKVPAALVVGNGFGKLAGATQITELGNLETPVLLCGTLNVPRVADALISWMLALPGMESVRSINPVVGETNDGGLNDIRGRHVGEEEVFEALRTASGGPVAEGSVGAGVGTRALGFKGGIGTSSRQVELGSLGTVVVGVLVQTNFGGELRVNGTPVGNEIRRRSRERGVAVDNEPAAPPLRDTGRQIVPGGGDGGGGDGSCMIIVATDAPLEARNLRRLASRALHGMARAGGSMSNGSGDYVIAFSTAESVRIDRGEGDRLRTGDHLGNDAVSSLFLAVMDATEEAILNSILRATTISDARGSVSNAIPIDVFVEVCREKNLIPPGN